MSDTAAGAVLITGATSDIGREVIRRLAEAGQPVRAMCRRRQQVDEFQAAGVDAVLGDLDDPASVRRAMQGCDRVFLLTLAAPTQRQHGRTAVDAAVATGVRRIVHLSTADADPDSAVPWAKAPALTDRQITASGLAWTLVKPTAFMQNLLDSAAPIKRGFLPQTSGDGAAGWIDSADIAAVVGRVLAEDGHESREYVLTGPELFSAPDLARELTALTGRRVRYLHLPGPVFFLVLRLSGMSAWMANGLVHQFIDVVRSGEGAFVTDTVRELTGAPPKRFRRWASEHRAAFVTP